MLKLHCSELWPAISKLAKTSSHRHIAVAYVSDDSQMRFISGDTLIADASENAIRTGQTSARVLRRAFRNGAQVFSCPDLHAKIMIFDRTAVIGSANISQSSIGRLLEAAVVTDNPTLVSAARNVLAQLKLKSKKLDHRILKTLLAIPVVRNGFPSGRARGARPRIEPNTGMTWLSATYALNLDRYQHEEKLAEAGMAEARRLALHSTSDVGWVRYAKSANIATRGHEGDWLIRMDGIKRDGKVVRVYRHAPILRKQMESNCVRIYFEDFKNSEAHSLSWRTFRAIALQAGISESRMGRRSISALTDVQAEALESLWKLKMRAR